MVINYIVMKERLLCNVHTFVISLTFFLLTLIYLYRTRVINNILIVQSLIIIRNKTTIFVFFKHKIIATLTKVLFDQV